MACSPARSPILTQIMAANPYFEQQMVEWQIFQAAIFEDIHDWANFRQHVYDITQGNDPGLIEPPEFNPFAAASHYSYALLSQYQFDMFFVLHMEDWQLARVAANQPACDWAAFGAHVSSAFGYDVGPTAPPEFGESAVTPPPPVAVSISVNKSSINNGENVLFTANVTPGRPPYTFKWYFGDGQIGQMGPTISHIYNLPQGTGPVTLRINLDVTDSANATVRSNDILLTLSFPGANPPPEPTPTTGEIPLIVWVGAGLALAAVVSIGVTSQKGAI